MTLDLDRLADKAINREFPARDEVLTVLASADDLLGVVAAAFRVRRPDSPSGAGPDLVRIRRRGAGTTLPANA